MFLKFTLLAKGVTIYVFSLTNGQGNFTFSFQFQQKKRTIFIEIYSVLSLAKRVTIYVFFYSPMANEWSHQLYRHWENL